MADVQMVNKARVLARFARIPALVQAEVGAQLKIEVADLVAAEKRSCPVSELEERPGQLRDSIESYPTPSRPLSYRLIVGARDSKGRLFGRYVQFGHMTEIGTFVAAQPWWFEVYRARRAGIRRRLSAAGRKAFKVLFPPVPPGS